MLAVIRQRISCFSLKSPVTTIGTPVAASNEPETAAPATPPTPAPENAVTIFNELVRNADRESALGDSAWVYNTLAEHQGKAPGVEPTNLGKVQSIVVLRSCGSPLTTPATR